jgi:GT2 family glycosyltransferase/glycosyltransferase involved in cell wall biosynthesis
VSVVLQTKSGKTMNPLKNVDKLLKAKGWEHIADQIRLQVTNIDSLMFDDRSYLYCNPDVADSVQAGHLKSAFQHWFLYGQKEGRVGAGVSPYLRRRLRHTALTKKPHVVFYGAMSAKSGLGSAARGYAKALKSAWPEIEIIDSTACLYLHRSAGTIAAPKEKADIVIIQHNPDAFHNFFKLAGKGILDHAHVIGLWVWELAAFRPEWVEHFAAVDEVWTMSEFCVRAVSCLAPAGMPIHSVSCVVEPADIGQNYSRKHFGIPEKSFAFLCVFDVSSAMERKNPSAVIQAFKDAFGDDPSVVLVMKYHSTAAANHLVREMRSIRTGSNIIFLDGLFSEDENASLKSACDCYVSAHRAEGFGINIAEAMIEGKPAIATDYSGNQDFCSSDAAFLIKCSLTEVTSIDGPYPKGAVWAEPDSDHLVELMREVRAGGPIVTARCKAGQREVTEALSVESVAKIFSDRLATVIGGLSEQEVRIDDMSQRPAYVWRHPLSMTSTVSHSDELWSRSDWPTISVVIPVYNISREYLTACVESVFRQSYPYWELCLCDDASTSAETLATLEDLRGRDQRVKILKLKKNQGISGCSNAAAEIATGSYLAFLDNDDTIHPDALYHYAKAIVREPTAELLYCDEDKIDFDGNYVDHYMKPEWSPEHLESTMYVLHMIVVKKKTFLTLGGYREKYTGAQDYDLALRLSALGVKIVHVPHVLYHWRMIPGSASAQVDAKPVALQNAKAALAEYAESKYGPDAYVEDGQLFGLFRVRRGKHLSPPVTLVITTNNVTKEVEGRGKINLPHHFLQSIADNTDYPNYRVLMVSNGVLLPETRALLKKMGGKEVVYQGVQSPFSFADKGNFAIRQAETDLFVLLNDDMEVRSAGWLRALMDYAQNGDVGAVGARLLYPSGNLQHVGMLIGVNETAAHAYHGHREDTVGYNGFPRIVRNYSAVTGACMASRRSLFEEVGGFDLRLAIDFNDTDYCLKLGEKGYRVVYTPFCELYHFESQTAVRTSQNPKEKAYFLERWQRIIDRDPYYSINLDASSVTFEAKASAWPVY